MPIKGRESLLVVGIYGRFSGRAVDRKVQIAINCANSGSGFFATGDGIYCSTGNIDHSGGASIILMAITGADGNTMTNGSNVSMIFDVDRSRRRVTANGC